jgi:hypothetical protein
MGNDLNLNKEILLKNQNTLRVFTGYIHLYQGKIIKLSDVSKYENRPGYTLAKHFGVLYIFDKYVMYGYYTSKKSFYVKESLYANEINYKCLEGPFSYINYPIISTYSEFKEFTDVRYDFHSAPSYVKRLALLYPNRCNLIEQSISNFYTAYEETKVTKNISVNRNIVNQINLDSKNHIFICSSLGVLNKHNSTIFLKNNIFNDVFFKKANEGLTGLKSDISYINELWF